VFVHHSGINGQGFKTLAEGERVEFEIVQEPKGLKAYNVVRMDAPEDGGQPDYDERQPDFGARPGYGDRPSRGMGQDSGYAAPRSSGYGADRAPRGGGGYGRDAGGGGRRDDWGRGRGRGDGEW
jgi:hypothetical protein